GVVEEFGEAGRRLRFGHRGPPPRGGRAAAGGEHARREQRCGDGQQMDGRDRSHRTRSTFDVRQTGEESDPRRTRWRAVGRAQVDLPEWMVVGTRYRQPRRGLPWAWPGPGLLRAWGWDGAGTGATGQNRVRARPTEACPARGETWPTIRPTISTRKS